MPRLTGRDERRDLMAVLTKPDMHVRVRRKRSG